MKGGEGRGLESAQQFDLLIVRLQEARLSKSALADDLRDKVINQIAELPINLRQVAEKLPVIQSAKTTDFYLNASTLDLEKVRTELRGIMRYRTRPVVASADPLILNVAEDPALYRTEKHKMKLDELTLPRYPHPQPTPHTH